LACWPGLDYFELSWNLLLPVHEPLFGRLSDVHVQMAPQSLKCLTEERADALRGIHSETQFRLHANVRVLPERRLADLSNFEQNRDWFEQAARINGLLQARAYTAHAGRRSNATLDRALDNARRCADLFGCTVGIEGHYPTGGDVWLVSSWPEYRQVFESGVPYALDMSHLNILAARTGRQEITLVAEMLACERCIEVHVSDNDGQRDEHRVCTTPRWWYPLLTTHVNPKAVIFSEGNHLDP
ncbi:MAG: hypothetical protein LBH10_03995, partial [Burkholderiaceae bacterium]|nr:hypothetical protein [Burkholderiaceae bacterium]